MLEISIISYRTLKFDICASKYSEGSRVNVNVQNLILVCKVHRGNDRNENEAT